MASPEPGARVGMEIRVRRSPSRTAVSKTPTKKSSAETTRSPADERIVIEASRATTSGGRWFVGSLTQMFPPTVPTVSHLDVGDGACDLGEDRPGDLDLRGGRAGWLSVTIAPSSSADSSAEKPMRAELGDAGQIDEHVGRGGPLLHHVDQRLPAGESSRAVVLAEQAHRLLEGGRAHVLDLSQQHGASLRDRFGDMSSLNGAV